jgi:hypothetical protein
MDPRMMPPPVEDTYGQDTYGGDTYGDPPAMATPFGPPPGPDPMAAAAAPPPAPAPMMPPAPMDAVSLGTSLAPTDAPVIPPSIALGPVLPKWYKRPSKPKLTEVIEDAEQEKDDHALRINLVSEMIDVMDGRRIGQFERDSELIEAGEVEVFQLTDIRDEHNAACTWGAGMDLSFSATSRDVVDRDEAAAKEDFLHFLFEMWSNRHSDAGYGHLQWSLFDTIQKTGMLAAWIQPDPTDPDLGLDLRMIDSSTVFPVYEGTRGLAKVYRVYTAKAGDVVGNFGDDDGEVERKVKKIAKGDSGRYDHRFEGEVIEYYDRHWGMVVYEGTMIRTWEHALGAPPFVITPGCFGQQGFTRTPDPTQPFSREDMVRGVSSSSDRSYDLSRVYQPFLQRRLRAHYQEEALAGRLMTMARRQMNPATVLKQGMLSQQDGIPEIDTTEGAVTALRDDDALEPFPNSPDQNIYQPLMMLVGQNRQTSMPPSLVLGQGIPAQSSGTAIDIAAQNGLEHWTPLVLCVEAFLTQVGQRALQIIQDWGDILGEDGSRGELSVPRRNPSSAPGEISIYHALTPEMIRRTGTRVRARMSKFNPLTMGGVANALIMAKSMNSIDQTSIIRILGFDPDIEGVKQRIEEDMLNDVPEIKQSKTLRTLKKQALRAIALDDMETAEEIANEARYVASQMQMSSLAKLKMIAGAAEPAGMDVPPPGLPGVPVPPDLGIEEGDTPIQMVGGGSPVQGGAMGGTQGGRPAGSGGPSGGMPPLPPIGGM